MKKSDHQSTHITTHPKETMEAYWLWHGLFRSYRSLGKTNTAHFDTKTKRNLQYQIIKQYFANFFRFPLWALSFLVPSFFRGKVTIWSNLKTLATTKEFLPLRLAIISQWVFLFAIVELGIVVLHYANPTLAATYSFSQTSWDGGAVTSTASHDQNRSGWTAYTSASSTIIAGDSLTLASVEQSAIETSDADFGGGTDSNTETSGGGTAADLVLSSTATDIYKWDTAVPGMPGPVSYGGMVYGNSEDEIFILQGSADVGFYKYTVSTNALVTLAPVPGGVSTGSKIIHNESEDYIYVLRGNNTTSFYRYSISGNSWTTLASAPGTVNDGGNMLRSDGEDYIYVLRGNNTTSFYRYSISGNSWTTLTGIPSTVKYSNTGHMIRYQDEDEIYVTPGNNVNNFYKYNISTNSWTQLASTPNAVYIGSVLGRNADDDEIYFYGGYRGGFQKYSISTDTWTALSYPPSSSYTGGSSSMVIDVASDYLYVFAGNSNNPAGSGLYRYTISSNTWSTLQNFSDSSNSSGGYILKSSNNKLYVAHGSGSTAFYIYDISTGSMTGSYQSNLATSPLGISLGAIMLHDESEDYIYVTRGGTTQNFYRYRISTNQWSTMASVPGTITRDHSLIRNGTDNEIYLLRSNSTSNLYKYSISGNSWTTLANAPGTIGVGSKMIRSGSEDNMYALQGNSGTGFYKYSISSNTWTTLTPVPSGVRYGANMIRNGNEDEIYVLPGNDSSAFYKYSISSNTWTTLANACTTFDTASSMIRDDSEMYIYALSGGYDSSICRYDISTNTWTSVGSGISTTNSGAFLTRHGTDDNLFAFSGYTNARFYKYNISSNALTRLIDVPKLVDYGGGMVFHNEGSTIYAVSGYNSNVISKFSIFSVTYVPSGVYISSIIDTGTHVDFTNLNYTATIPSGTMLSVDVRSGDTDTPDGSWSSWQTNIGDGDDISTLGDARYVQYRVNLATSDTSVTPRLDDITFHYDAYTSGSLISSPYDAIGASNVLGSISWEDTAPIGTAVRFQLRTSPNGTSWGSWMGPDGTEATYFTDKSGAQDMPAALIDSEDDRWMQYKATLSSDGALTPTLDSMTLTYVVNGPPDISFTTSTYQNMDGLVDISYQVRDTDTTDGVTPGSVNITLEYCTSLCSSSGNEVWEAVPTSSLQGDFGSGISVNTETPDTYTQHTITWSPKDSYPNHFNEDNFKVRLVADDEEAANNSASAESNVFVLDTADPIVSVLIDGRAGSEDSLTVTVDDDSIPGLLMKLSNNSDLTSDGLNASSGVWIAYTEGIPFAWDMGNGTTVYYQVKDVYGNMSLAGEIGSQSTPDIPSHVFIRDVSNANTSDWRELIAWDVLDDPAPGFAAYTIYRSSDGETYSEIATVDDRTVNSYMDTNLDTELTYSYKITATDNDGHISQYSSIVSDRPDAVEDIEPPLISNVTTSTITPETVKITWDTDELADSAVDYTLDESGDESGAESISIVTLQDNEAGIGSHRVILSGLTPGTTYYFQVRSSDPFNNSATSTAEDGWYSVTTPPGPVISEVASIDILNASATIVWTTDQDSDSSVVYSTDPSFEDPDTMSSEETVTSHAIVLSGLTQNTTYYYYVTSENGVDMNIVDGAPVYYSFRTTADLTPPVISFDSDSDIGVSDGTITITFSTDEAATSTLTYGTSDSYGSTAVSNSLDTDHRYALGGLLKGTTYYFRLYVSDENGNRSDARVFTATTTDTTDYDAPVISGVETAIVTDDEALISFVTDEAARGTVWYGTVSSTLDMSEAGSGYNSSHLIRLSGLTTSTEYYYLVTAVDQTGNSATSTIASFTTLETLSEESEAELRELAAEALGYDETYTEGSGASGGVIYVDDSSDTDTTPPTVLDVVVEQVSGTAATLSWRTDESANSSVEFGTNGSYARAAIDWGQVLSHSLELTDLSPLTSYSYRVTSMDAGGNRSRALTGTFTTTLSDVVTKPDVEAPTEETKNIEQLFLASVDRATKVIRSLSTEVAPDVLDTKIAEQNKIIKEMAQILPAPLIGGEPRVEVGSSYATVHWNTDKEATSLVAYTPHETYAPHSSSTYDRTVGNPDDVVTAHSVEIKNLHPNTLYHYQVISRTLTGIETASPDFTFRTTASRSEIVSYTLDEIAEDHVTVSWITSVPTNSMISYSLVGDRTDASELRSVRDPSYTTTHTVTVPTLEAGARYQLTLSGTDYGNNVVKKELPVISTSGTDVAPVISQLQSETSLIAGSSDTVQAVISWNTNELATGRVYYRTGFGTDDRDFTDATVLEDGYSLRHVLVITDFEPGTVYQFQVESTDASGNSVQSKTITLLTPKREQSVFQVILSNFEDIFSWVGKVR